MATRRTGISRDLIIHPGETISDVLLDRGITQAELAARAGVSSAYVSNVISGKKDISANFAMSLEYALGVPKSFWLNLQANYDSELLGANETQTITTEEMDALSHLKEVIKYLRSLKRIPVAQRAEETILELRKKLQLSNIANLKALVPCGEFRISEKAPVDPLVMGAWLRLCQISGEQRLVTTKFDPGTINALIAKMKEIMLDSGCEAHKELADAFSQYGIDFSVVKNFKGAPVHGFISSKKDGSFQMVLTIRGAFADIFWFSLFHEIGHIANGDVTKSSGFIDAVDSNNKAREDAADRFASDALLSPRSYEEFVDASDFSYNAISRYAGTQNVPAYIVIGRLQKEGLVPYSWYSQYKLRYKWAC